jgi:hypothetical protein
MVDDSGAIAVIVALLAIVLFGFGALVIDIGNAQQVRSQAQGAVDSAALAGVQVLAADAAQHNPTPDALSTAVTSAVEQAVEHNIDVPDGAWSGCIDAVPLAEIGRDASGATPCISFAQPDDDMPGSTDTYGVYQVRVQFPTKDVETTFGGLFGVSSIKVRPVSVAQSGEPPTSPCVACDPMLDDTGTPIPGQDADRILTQDESQVTTWLTGTPQDALPPGTCPTPGLYEHQQIAISTCALPAGSYIFDNSDVTVIGSLTLQSPDATTLVFAGTGSFAVKSGAGGALHLTPPALSGALVAAGSAPTVLSVSPLVSGSPVVSGSPTQAPPSSTAPISSQPVSSPSASVSSSPVSSPPVSSPPVSSPPVSSPPVSSGSPPPPGLDGVALFFDKNFDGSFDLGDNFSITGTVYAPDAQNAIWDVAQNECTTPATQNVNAPHCVVTKGQIEVEQASFTSGVVPYVDEQPEPAPADSQPHLVK